MNRNCVLSVIAFAAMMPLAAQTAPFRWPEGKRVAVSFSFDDARASQIDIGVPLFDKYGAKATFYVNPRNMEKRLDGWKKAAAGGHEIGNHTEWHPCTANFPWSRTHAIESYTLAAIEKEIEATNAATERLLGVRPTTFAYPCGQKFVGRGEGTISYVPVVARRMLAGRGFRDEAPNDPAFCDLAQLLGVESDGLTFEEMRTLTGKAEGRWLVFAGHEIGKPAFQTTNADALEQFLKYARDPANGVWLVTVKEGAERVRAYQKK